MQNYQFDYHQYKQKINKSPKVYFSVLLVFIILLTGIACFLLQKTDHVEFYFVNVESFYKYSDANKLASELQQKNAAGYVYFDDAYHVIACAYLNKEDANTVANHMKNEYKKTTVLTLKVKNFNKNYKNKEKNAIKTTISANETAIKNFYENIIKYDKNEINKDKYELNLKKISATYSNECKEFLNVFKNHNNFLTAKQNIISIKNNLNENCTNWKAKYNLVKICFEHYSFLEFLS